MVDPDDPDLDRFPLYAEAARHKRVADLAPGDAIFLPPMGWHHVCSEGAVAVLVNYWFGQPAERFPFAVCAGEIGRASCRERVCPSVSISVVAVSLKKKNNRIEKVSH